MKMFRPLAVLAVLFGTALTALPALAEPATATRNINVRSGPGLSYEVVDLLIQGEPVDKRQCNTDGSWCYIRHEGANGWVAAVFLETSASQQSQQNNTDTQQPNNTPMQNGYTSTVALNVRSGPGSQYAVVDTLNTGETVSRGECTTDGSWCYITHTGTDGWVASRYLRAPGSRQPTSQPAQSDQPNGDTYYARSAVNVRSGPGTNYRAVDTLKQGEQVTRSQCTSDESWCYVTHNGPDGWVSNNYLISAEQRAQVPPRVDRPQPGRTGQQGQNGNDNGVSAGTGTAITGMPVRARPTLFSPAVGRIERGEVVEVDQCDQSSNWCHINEPDLNGWVPAAFMDIQAPQQAQQPAIGQTQVVTSRSIVMRSGPGLSYNVVGFVPANETLTIERCNFGGDWCQITRGNRRGWIATRYLALPQDAPAAATQKQSGDVCFTGFGGIRICLNTQTQ